MKKDVIRVGDTIQIVNPEFVVRVGYPMSFDDACKAVSEKFSGHILNMLISMGWRNETNIKFGKRDYRDTESRIEKALAFEYLTREKFGGNQRQIFTKIDEFYRDRQIQVVGKRVAKTGTYFAPSSYQDYWTGEWDCEDGGLDKMRTHIILQINYCASWVVPANVGYLEIEAKNVRKVSNE